MTVELKTLIRDVPDFPKKGIIFKDICPLLQNHTAFSQAVDQFARRFEGSGVDVIVGIESRGFIFGAALAYKMGAAFVPVRKVGKLPSEVIQESYALEYGNGTVEMHRDAIVSGQRVLLVDDLLATGGTMSAAVNLVKRLGGHVVGAAFLVELTFLDGRKALPGQDVVSLIQY
ncbi:MAG: adenine phosphoribosyltransferase [Chloroflexi bacterium]|nr:adenine phosphoribosyltransferase [Chloroflexota bacterium]